MLRLATDQDGKMLVWVGDPTRPESDKRADLHSESRFYALLRAVEGLLQREKRVTYRELKHVFGLDEALLGEIRNELWFKRLADDENGECLVWTGATPPDLQPAAMTTQPVSPVSVGAPLPSLPAPTPLASTMETPPDESFTLPETVRSFPEAERRQLTVMFCDLADSTPLSQELDPEDLREVVRAYQTTAAEVIQKFEGHIAQYLGDGLLIYFGWPVAHEDDAQRALHSGLGIIEAIATTLKPRLQAEKGVQLTVRLGIHTGSVVVGEMGGGGRHENLATGETVNIAARLEGLAAPDTVMISHVTARLVRDAFALEALGSQELKGVVEPMDVFRVHGPRDTERDGDEHMPEGDVFLVGRDEEVGLLLRRWEQSKEGLDKSYSSVVRRGLASRLWWRQHVIR